MDSESLIEYICIYYIVTLSTHDMFHHGNIYYHESKKKLLETTDLNENQNSHTHTHAHTHNMSQRATHHFKTPVLLLLVLALCSCLTWTSILLFTDGFFPAKKIFHSERNCTNDSNNSTVFDSDDSEQVEKKFDRVVLMLIDGMRYDFIRHMPFVHGTLEARWGRKNGDQDAVEIGTDADADAIGFVTYAHPPTVTMPRLRAMMTGQMPQFIADIVENLQEQQEVDQHHQAVVEMDSVLLQLKRKYPRSEIHLFGDQTWFRLFGRHMFSTQSQGTTSLFVKDTVEVDLNVTRDVFTTYSDILLEDTVGDCEDTSPPWSMLILHYLGLDHVGHCGDLHTPRMIEKLHEMDDVVQRLVQDHVANEQHRTLLLLCSDHGMTDGGNHGGASSQETDAFSLFIAKRNTLLLPQDDIITAPLDDVYTLDTDHLVFSHREGSDPYYRINQIDLAPTLSLLMGLPIPSQSMGKIIPHLFIDSSPSPLPSSSDDSDPMSSPILSMAARFNMAQLNQMLSSTEQNESHDFSTFSELAQKSHSMTLAVTVRDNETIYVAFAVMIVGLLFSFALHLKQRIHFRKCHILLFGLLLVLLRVLHSFFCSDELDSVICHNDKTGIMILVWIGLSITVGTLALMMLQTTTWRHVSSFDTVNYSSCSQAIYWISRITVFVLHPLLLTSSSMIEEEHHLWYTASTTIALIIMADHLIDSFKRTNTISCTNTKIQPLMWPLMMLISTRLMKMYNVSGIRYATENPSLPAFFTIRFTQAQLCASVIALMAFEAFQCLQHWKHHHDKNRILHAAALELGMIAVLVYKLGPTLLPMSTTAQNLVAKFAYFTFSFNGFTPIANRIFGIPIHTGQSYMRYVITRIMVSLIGILLLIHRIEQALLVLLISTQLLSVARISHIQTDRAVRCGDARMLFGTGELVSQALVLHILGMSSYYAFGRSISIASIDFSGAYTGLDSFQPMVVGFLGILIHFGGPLLYSLLAIRTTVSQDLERFGTNLENSVDRVLTLFGCMRSLTLLISSSILFAMREHLFIWSVFSPKWLYEIGWQVFWSLVGFLWVVFVHFIPKSVQQKGSVNNANL